MYTCDVLVPHKGDATDSGKPYEDSLWVWKPLLSTLWFWDETGSTLAKSCKCRRETLPKGLIMNPRPWKKQGLQNWLIQERRRSRRKDFTTDRGDPQRPAHPSNSKLCGYGMADPEQEFHRGIEERSHFESGMQTADHCQWGGN